jgi:hypothetical protein
MRAAIFKGPGAVEAGVPHGQVPFTQAFFRNVGWHGGPAPGRIYIPGLLGDVLDGTIDPGRVFDYETDLDHVAAYRAMDERRAVKSLVRSTVMTDTNWPAAELETIGAAQEIGLASRRPDGSLRPFVTMWVARADDSLYDAAYHAKYDRYGPRIVGSVTGPGARTVTVRLLPQSGK